ncbi:MAG: LpxI family protein [Thermodesulfobacteriota bacterium]
MPEEREHVGIIAGGGTFPMLVADAAKRRGCLTVAVAHEGETDPALEEHVDELVWVRLGQLGRLIRAFRRRGVRRVMMAGTIAKRRMFSRLRPDLKGLAVMSRMAVFHDDGILRNVSREMEKEGILVIPSTHFLPELMAPPGVLTRRKPTKDEVSDIRFGWRMAKELGRLDIGQCVVVRSKTVIALEAMEGTDETIRRGGRIAGEKAVVVKVSKPSQDLRFDVPSVGPVTISIMKEVKASVLTVEAGKTLLFEMPAMIRLADEAGIAVVSMDYGERI